MWGRWIAVLIFSLSVLSFWPASSIAVDEVGTPLPFTTFYAMVVDEAHHRVYIDGGPGTTGVEALDFGGKLVGESRIPSPAGMALVGNALFVVHSDTGVLDVLDTTKPGLPLTRSIAVPGFTTYGDLAYLGGRLWLAATGDPRDLREALVEVNQRTGRSASVHWLPRDPSLIDARFAKHSTANRLALFTDDTLPVSVVSCQLENGKLSARRVIHDVGAPTAGTDVSVTSDGHIVVAADVSNTNDPKEGVREFDSITGRLVHVYDTGVTLATAEYRRGGALRPDAVDVTDDLALVAGGSASSGWSDVWVFRTGHHEPMWTHDFELPSITTLPGGIAWSQDAQSLFVVAGSIPRTRLPVSSVVPARFFVLHPGDEPSAGPARTDQRVGSSLPEAAGPKGLSALRQLLADVGVLALAGSLLWLMLFLSPRVQNAWVHWMMNVFVTYCLFFLVFAVANLLTALVGRNAAQTEGGEWVIWVVLGAVALGWFFHYYAHMISKLTRQRILVSLVVVAITSATFVNVALSPPR